MTTQTKGQTMTTAQKIANRLNNNGQVWETKDGVSFSDLIAKAVPQIDYRDGYGTDVIRYTFDDGSVITEAGAGWDFGYADCYCWQGAGHTELCDMVPIELVVDDELAGKS